VNDAKSTSNPAFRGAIRTRYIATIPAEYLRTNPLEDEDDDEDENEVPHEGRYANSQWNRSNRRSQRTPKKDRFEQEEREVTEVKDSQPLTWDL